MIKKSPELPKEAPEIFFFLSGFGFRGNCGAGAGQVFAAELRRCLLSVRRQTVDRQVRRVPLARAGTACGKVAAGFHRLEKRQLTARRAAAVRL